MQSTYPEVPSTPCTLWEGAVQSNGYGSVTNGRGGSMLAHRKAWEAAHGPIPAGMTIDHLCRQKLCVNVDHLEVVTLRENVQRALAHQRELRRGSDGHVRCVNDHAQTEDNVRIYVTKRGYVKNICIPCARAAARKAYHAAVARGENPNAAMVARRSARREAARNAKAA